jgi:serine/threonine-protein kinase
MPPSTDVGRVVGRYVLYDEIASGGMASVYFGRMTGAVGFRRTVAVKRLHPHLAGDPDFVAMILDEARLAARIVHPNVVATLDVVTGGPPPGEIFIVMEYMHGESLSRLQRALWQRGERAPVSVSVTIVAGVLHGLHAAHEAKDERGAPLGIVHRDVSPQNIMLGADGSVRILDFGVAKAAGRMQNTREGSVKGKIPYMAPEQIRGGQVGRVTDVYAASVVLWELLTGRRLFEAENDVMLIHRITTPGHPIDPPSTHNPHVSPELDALVMRGLSYLPERRYETARDMALALERVAPLVPASGLGEWTSILAEAALAKRAALVTSIESMPGSRDVAPASAVASFASTLKLADAPRSSHDFAATIKDQESLGTHAGTALTTGPLQAARRKKRMTVALAFFAITCGLAGGAVLWFVRTPHAVSSTGASMAAPQATPAPAAATPELPPTPKADEPVAAAPSAAEAPKARPAGGKRVSCNPPYTLDAQGIKVYKRECLK